MIREREFRVGDRVLCRHNNLELGVRNGTRATITALDPATLHPADDGGATRPIPLDYAFKHLDHGYALTGHAAQGATVDAPSCSRATRARSTSGATSPAAAPAPRPASTSPARPRPGKHTDGRPTSTSAGAPARAMSASASEPLATEQLHSADRATARAYAAAPRQLEQQRARAQQRLAQAEDKLDRLGWRGRGRRGDELRNEIAWQRTALRLADEKLREPPRTDLNTAVATTSRRHRPATAR